MANCVSVMTSPYFAMTGQPEKRHNVRAQQQEVMPDWFEPIIFGDHVSLRLH